MSYYTAICGVCPDKHFIKPGTEDSATPLHEGYGHEHNGTQAADAARRDADHMAVPVDFNAEGPQRRMLTRALTIIRDRVPNAVFVDLTTSDQDSYGFVLGGVQDADETDLLPAWDDFTHPLAGLGDEVENEINDLSWDGVVGEDRGGYATIDLRKYFG
jgi:hypothetical protein